MSTRATIHWTYKRGEKPIAITYRHADGYPNGLGKDIEDFIEEVDTTLKDKRFNDPSYLAAKWIVWDADRHGEGLNFVGVGVVTQDPGDIEYRYIVICKDTNKKPEVVTEEV